MPEQHHVVRLNARNAATRRRFRKAAFQAFPPCNTTFFHGGYSALELELCRVTSM
jgi:hypothetical protein